MTERITLAWKTSEAGLNNEVREYVAADYDALAARLAKAERLFNKRWNSEITAPDFMAALRDVLWPVHSGTADSASADRKDDQRLSASAVPAGTNAEKVPQGTADQPAAVPTRKGDSLSQWREAIETLHGTTDQQASDDQDPTPYCTTCGNGKGICCTGPQATND